MSRPKYFIKTEVMVYGGRTKYYVVKGFSDEDQIAKVGSERDATRLCEEFERLTDEIARLKAEVERLTEVAQVNKAAAEAVRFSYENAKMEVERLRSQFANSERKVERLVKTGIAMSMKLPDTDEANAAYSAFERVVRS